MKTRLISRTMWLAVVLLASFAANAATTVEVLDTYPSGSSVRLAPNETFYIRLRFETDEPIKIWARPYFRGEPVRAGSNPSYVYTGSGEALGWFFLFDESGAVDEIRISTGDGSIDGTHVALTYPIEVEGSRKPVAREPAPDWVEELRALDKERQRAAAQAAASQPVSAGEGLMVQFLIVAVFALGVAGIIVSVRAFMKWRGGWRVAAAVPLALMGFVVLRIIFGVALDPTSHNLWPFEILMVALPSLVIVGVLTVARKIARVEE